MEISWESAGLGSGTVAILMIAYKLYTMMNHTRIKSQCCGKKFEASIDVEKTTPAELKIKIPERVEMTPV
jgi:hypothetical protein